MLKDIPVKDKPQNAPDGEQQVGFGFQIAAGEQVRDDGAEEKQERNNKAADAQKLAGCLAFAFGDAVAAQRNIGIGQSTADGDGINQPDNGRASQKGNGQ